MELLGDLERVFATAIYPNRALIAVIGLVGVAALGVLAWRRRWDLVARRRPRRSLATLLVGLALVGPAGWYLGSPLVVTSTIDEPPPTIGSAAATPDSSSATGRTVGERRGMFAGADEFHFGRGVARLIETAPGEFAVRLEDFEVRNGPDLYVYASPSADGYTAEAVEVSRLKADRGDQNYALPPGTDVSEIESIVIWCKQFAVLFASAPLS